MHQIGKVALPPKGTVEHDSVIKYLQRHTSKEQDEYIGALWDKSVSIVTSQQLNGAGNQTDQAVRYFQKEYNNRAWSHGLHSFPSSFNVAEAFYHYKPDLNTFVLHDEVNSLFSFPDFVNWYTSCDISLDYHDSLEKMEEGVIYTYDNLLDPGELLYKVEQGSEIAISGFAMVRFGTEVSIMCVAGECTDLQSKTKELIELHSSYEPIEGKNGIIPDRELLVEAVGLKSKMQLWRFIALTRFNIDDMSQSVRYILYDSGISFDIITDDPTIFLNNKGEQLVENAEAMLEKSINKVNGYNALFDLCSSALFLPIYFDHHSEEIVIERCKTKYADEVGKISFKKIKVKSPIKYRIAHRNVNVLREQRNDINYREVIYSTQNFHMETSGFWKTLEPGKYGVDKKGDPIHGRTWVSKKITWMEAEEPTALMARGYLSAALPEGKNPGYIYIMRSPLHLENVFKIGLTTRSSEARAKELSAATGVPGRIYVINQWAVSDCNAIEKEIHNRLVAYRVDHRREFFEGPLEHFMITVNMIIQELDDHQNSSHSM